jgi:hypothetical protein
MIRRLLSVYLVMTAALMLAPAAHARAPAGFVGMTSEELGGVFTTAAYRTQALKAQRRAGVRLLRQTFDWTYIERQPEGLYPLPPYDWSIQDPLVLAAARNGITILPVLFGAPDFLSSRPAGATDSNSYPPKDPATMARFASEAVARYGPGGSLWRENPGVRARPIKAWQVWNEPSLRPYWGGKPSAREYVRLLKAVNDAIKRRDHRAEVVSAGIPPSILAGSVPVKKYVDQMYRAGAKKAFDTLAINTYARSAGELGRLLGSVRKIMNRHGDRRAKIWITELGWCDKGPKHRFCVGKRRQASLIRSSLKLIRKERRKLRLRGLVYFSWRDSRPYAPDFRDQWGLHTGLLKLNGRAKPSLSAFRRGVRPFR